jgi:diguanylate cyclase
MTSWLVITIAILAALAGLAAAVWLAARWNRGPQQDHVDQTSQFARDTLTRLQDVTRRVKADVDEHKSCVEEISAQLSSSLDGDDESVLAAVADLIEANQRMKRQLDTAEERLQAQARQIESHAVEARTDALTQVANRRAFDDELKRCALDFERRGTPTTLLLVDVDHFKKFNDTHGHQTGDDVIRAVARVLRCAIGDSGLVARYGGEEFAVVFTGLAFPAVAAQAERARQAIATMQLRTGGQLLSVTASGGLAEFLPGDNDKQLIQRADESLYASKKAGRNCAHYNDGRSNHKIQLDVAAALAGIPQADKIGDEWLFEADDLTDSDRRPMPHVSSRPVFFDDMIRRLSHCRRGGTPSRCSWCRSMRFRGSSAITGPLLPTWCCG